jgi:hypothetical protein
MSAEDDEKLKKINNKVAVTVIVLTIGMAIFKIKDDNINQAMQKAKAESVDAWSEYQAARVKLHTDELGLATASLLNTAKIFDHELAAGQMKAFKLEIEKYQARSKETFENAKKLAGEYDRWNFRDDQFDISEAFASIAIGLAAVASLTAHVRLLYTSWALGAFSYLFGIAGFCGLGIHPDWLAAFLGT